jgi:L-fucose mutarotase
MLKGIDPVLTADLLHALMLMGHGDDIVVCDVNHPAASIAAETVHGRLLTLAGCDIPRATRAILSLMPLDTFVEAPVKRMKVVGDPDRLVDVHRLMQATLDEAEGRPVTVEALERFAFYEAARRAFAIVRTSDPGPYGCFILRKGVVELPRSS